MSKPKTTKPASAFNRVNLNVGGEDCNISVQDAYALLAQLQYDLGTASPWQPGSTAPKDGSPFVCLDKADEFGLITVNGYIPIIVRWSGNGFLAFPFRSLAQFFPAYWIPIPPFTEAR